MNRRQFLQTAGSAALAGMGHAAAQPEGNATSFFVVGDTHYFADENAPDQLTPKSRELTSRLVERLNGLPGTAFPEAVGGGIVEAPKGVIHAGDIIDSGDKSGPKYDAMQRTELAAFTADWGINGGDGKLKWPVF